MTVPGKKTGVFACCTGRVWRRPIGNSRWECIANLLLLVEFAMPGFGVFTDNEHRDPETSPSQSQKSSGPVSLLSPPLPA